jgi:hypothetical protein
MYIIFLMSSCNTNNDVQENKFKIDLWDYKSSMAYTLYYHLDNKEIFVVRIGGLENETSDTLYREHLNDTEKNIIYNALCNIPIDSLENEYINPLTEDGDQKKIELLVNDKTKSVLVSNVYQKDISSLINLLNEFLDDKLKIEYRNSQ